MRQIHRNIAVMLSAVALLAGGPVHAADRVPNDIYYDQQWYLHKIGAPEAWNKSLGLETVTIAFIDTGVDIDHPDLKDNIWHNTREIPGNGIDDDGNGYVDDVNGWDFVSNDNDPRPVTTGDFSVVGANHGTVDAGVAAARADNRIGIAGVTWQTRIMAIRALDSNGKGDPEVVRRAVEYAVDNGADIINLSFAGTAQSDALRTELRRAYDAGVFIVAAAGNASDGGTATDLDVHPMYPICLDFGSDENFIFGVASTDEQDKRAAFSNYGAGCVDASAPGTHVLSTQLYRPDLPDFTAPYGGYYDGTSASAAMVSGTAALIKALDRHLTPKQITHILTGTAVDIDGLNPDFFGKLGRGRIDAAAAVAAAAAMLKPGGTEQVTPTIIPDGPGGLIVTAPASGRGSELRMFTPDGLFVRSFMAFPEGFTGGVSLAAGDFDRTKRSSIVAGAGPGGLPQVRIFDINTRPIGGFLAYDGAFRGGVHVATGDFNGDGIDDIVTGAGPGGGPHVRVFRPDGTPIGGFFAFESAHRSGVNVAVGDINGDGKPEIVASAPDAPDIRAYDIHGLLVADITPLGGAKLGDATVSVADADGDGKPDFIVDAIVKGAHVMTAYAADGRKLALAAAPRNSPASGILLGSGKWQVPTVSAYPRFGAAPFSFLAYEAKFMGGVNVTRIE